MNITEKNWKHVICGLAAWHDVPSTEWLSEAWSGPIRLSTLVSQLEILDLGARIVEQPPDRLKGVKKTPVIGFLEEDNELVVILPPKKGTKLWTAIPSSGGESTFPGLRELRKAFQAKKWSNQSVLVEPLAAARRENSVGVSGDWFWSAIWKYRRDFLPILPASLLINLFALAMPLYIMNVYDRVVPNEALDTLWVLTTGVCVIFAFEFLLRIMRGAFVDAAGKGADRILSGRVFRQLTRLELSSRPPSAGNLAGKAVGYETVREFLSSIALIGLIDFPFALFMFVIVFMVGGSVGWMPVVATGLILFLLLLIQPLLAKYSGISHKDRLNRQSLLSETANGLESIKAVNAGRSLENRMAELVEESADNILKQRKLTQMGSAFTAFCTHLTTIAVIAFGTWLISRGEMSMGGLIACVMIVNRGMAPLGQVSQMLLRLQAVRASLSGLRDVMKLESEAEDGKLAPVFDCPEIRLSRAGFRYQDQPVAALSEVSLKIEPGEKVGIIGRAGSGKSTLLRLLNRQLTATDGLVLFDGIDAAQISPRAIRRVCGYLPQDGTLFVGSVKENISLGSKAYSDDEILEAARQAGVMTWANRHPMGIDREVGERGILLSGGQRQTVLIARLLLRKPGVYLLDEPTNFLDLTAVRQFREAMAGVVDGKKRTIILATHKMSLLKLVDRVIVLEGGKILLQGPRDEVLAALNEQNSKTK